MKRFFIMLIIIGILFCFPFTSCRHKETYKLLNSIDEISHISIVDISFARDGEIIQTVKQDIPNQDDFMNDFTAIDCYTYYGDPTGITPEGVEDRVIKITYVNNEYELINWSGQAKYTEERGFRYYSGYSVFNEGQFELLITKYSS